MVGTMTGVWEISHFRESMKQPMLSLKEEFNPVRTQVLQCRETVLYW